MAKIQRAEVLEEAKNNLGISNSDNPLTETEDKIRIVSDSTRNFIIQSRSGSAINATTATILTTSAIDDTYLLGATLSMLKDVTATSTQSAISIVTADGVTVTLLRIIGLTATIQYDNISLTIPFPGIKLAKNTAMTVTNTTTTGNVSAGGSLVFYVKKRV